MFNFVTKQQDGEQSSSVPDLSDAASTRTSSSDTPSSFTDIVAHASKDTTNGSCGRQASVTGVGLFDDRVFKHQRTLLELLDRLRSFGLHFELDLPQIVAVGMQNVGKSSLIEGMCGIKLPRASGTCTRCPIELRMKRSPNKWKCSISLEIFYDEQGRSLSHPQTIVFGDVLFNPDDVEDRVKRAQWAILTPSVPPKEFLHISTSGARDLSFSKNYILIQVEGPNVADLSFVDLPGLVASARQGNQSDIGLIEDLVSSYIQKRSTLILLTIACESDFYTQGAYQLVKNNDPEGVRTIGVLTKPDRIAKGDEERWLRFIKNEEEQFEHGWFCVKQPDAIQLKEGIDWVQSRDSETQWFDSTSPWNNVRVKCSGQLGTMNLVEKLGKTLAGLIAQRLPELRGELEDILQETEEELQGVPAPPSENALSEIMHLLKSFCDDVVRHAEGIPTNDGLIQSINARQEQFKLSVGSLAPEFRPYKLSESAADLPQLPPCEFLDGEEEDSRAAEQRLVMAIDEAMNLLKNSRTRELPNHYSYEVLQGIIIKATARWASIAFTYFEDVLAIVSVHLKHLVEDHFEHFEKLLSIVKLEVNAQLEKRLSETREKLKWAMNFQERPFTLNHRYLADYKSKFMAYYKMFRFNVLHREPMTYIQTFNSGRSVNYVSEVLSSLNKMNIKDVKALDLAKLLPEDDCEPALIMMAEVSAYYQVASKRFIDLVPAIVDHDFVLGLSRSLQTALMSAIIRDDAPNRCKSLLQESPFVTARRLKLQRKHERLEAARKELVSLHWQDMY
ncbi:hypothetical protein ACEPAI_8270 [Sanghuangporus weigelae]